MAAGGLPSVSWIVAPEACSEHPNWPANYGAWYTAQMLEALVSNPEVWSRTALFITHDENGGFFDHVVPPTPAATPAQGLSTVDAARGRLPSPLPRRPGAGRKRARAAPPRTRRHVLAPGARVVDAWALKDSAGWYDLAVTVDGSDAFLRRLAGRVETGRPSTSDPALA